MIAIKLKAPIHINVVLMPVITTFYHYKRTCKCLLFFKLSNAWL